MIILEDASIKDKERTYAAPAGSQFRGQLKGSFPA
jgi:hypothetical protein